jgi:hypothetical protein
VNSKLLLLIMSVAERQGGTPQADIEEKLSAYATVKNACLRLRRRTTPILDSAGVVRDVAKSQLHVRREKALVDCG